jgi:hypothetical protein
LSELQLTPERAATPSWVKFIANRRALKRPAISMSISCGVLSSTDNMLPLSAMEALYRQYIAYMLIKQELKARACYVGKKALIGGTI